MMQGSNGKYAILFDSVRLGPKVSPNRFYQPPFGSSFGNDRPGTQSHFQAVRAEGGWGVVHIDFCSIHPSSDVHGNVGARLWDDDDIRNLSITCEAIHEWGSLAAVELWYGAANATNHESRLPALGASQIQSGFRWMQSCVELDRREIREVRRWYVDAALRARAAGFDVINLYVGHHQPLTYQFLDPAFNKRTDEYGGSFENRARFFLETLEDIAAAVGDDCTIAVRLFLGATDGSDTLTMDDTLGAIELADPLVHLWDLPLADSSSDVMPSRLGAQGYQRPWLELVRPATSKPIVGFGRLTDPDLMVDLVSSGLLQMIGGARPAIADPFLPRKIQEGRLDDVRECIGCNICVSRFAENAMLACTQNPTAGEEFKRGWHPERFGRATNADLSVLVVGAGPAGLECATVLGRRGFEQVHLVDADERIGGTLNWVTRLPGLGEWRRVLDWRASQLDRLNNVQVITGVELGVADVLAYGADLVVIATGSRWAGDGLSGFSHDGIVGADAVFDHVLTPEQVMVEGKPIRGNEVLVYDCDGYFTGVGIAEKLAREGRRVRLVTPHETVSPFSHFTLEGPSVYATLHQLGVRFELARTVSSIEPGRVVGGHLYTGEQVAWEADAVVLVTQRVSQDSLYRELRAVEAALADGGVQGVYRIGDCAVPRLIADAIFDGHRLAREIDSPDPGTPLAFRRERAMLPDRALGLTPQDGRVS